jgi:hypothetical protein
MTEPEWLACTNPKKMLKFLRGRASERKLRLFACACCRRIWHLLADKPYRHAVDVAERCEERLANATDVASVPSGAYPVARYGEGEGAGGPLWLAGLFASPSGGACANSGDPHAPAVLAASVSMQVASVGSELFSTWAASLGVGKAVQAALLREVVHAPFRAIHSRASWRSWNYGTVPALARAIYDDRDLPSGHLDHHRLAVLADALEDAGCSDQDILVHCRGPGPHVRGCWVIDLLLGKE